MTRHLKSRLLFISLVLIATSCGQSEQENSNSIIVTGHAINGLDTEFMTRSYSDDEGNRKSDTILVENGSFTYQTNIEESSFMFFWPNVESTIKRTDRGYYPVKSSQFAFLANPGDEIVFTGEVTDFINAYPSGTIANDDLAKINGKIFPLMNQSVNYLLETELLDENDDRLKVIKDSIDLLDNQVLDFKKAFIKSNLSSEAAVWYLSDMMLRSQISDDEAIKIFNALDEQVNDYRYYKEVEKRIQGIEATREGMSVSNFITDATFTGDTFEFDALKGKYIMMDFWGTWCGPCVAEMPKVKAYQEKYADKLTVLGVNQGDSKERIDKFITPKGYTWTHLMNGKDEDDFVLNFNVAGFPTKFIIDPEGKILYRFVGDGEESFHVIDSLLQ
ncbi:MAG: redoxin domain-containing protein [Saprospiraceae bacterium]|nr:redoxin domain-containing protein [Saprospiraceae bacterium]